jgi:hypothetical protein
MYHSAIYQFADELFTDLFSYGNPDLRARWIALLLLLGPETQPLILADKLRYYLNQNLGGDIEPERFPEDHADCLPADLE